MHQATARLAGVKVMPGDSHGRHISVACEEALDVWESTGAHEGAGAPPNTVGFGIEELDEHMGWMRAGELVLIAGRPRTGVPEVMTTILVNNITAGIPTLLVSPKQSAATWYERIVAAAAQVPLRHLRSGRLSEDSWHRIADSTEKLAGAPVFIDDAAVQTPATIARTAIDLGLGAGSLVVIDDLQQLAADVDGANLYETTAGIGRALKVLARERNVVVVASSGLTRGPEMRVDKRPMLEDLRGAGDLEEAADHVLLTLSEDAYDPDTGRLGEIDLRLVKGPGVFTPNNCVTCALQRHYSRIVGIEQ